MSSDFRDGTLRPSLFGDVSMYKGRLLVVLHAGGAGSVPRGRGGAPLGEGAGEVVEGQIQPVDPRGLHLQKQREGPHELILLQIPGEMEGQGRSEWTCRVCLFVCIHPLMDLCQKLLTIHEGPLCLTTQGWIL
jgi:hypothetical protein